MTVLRLATWLPWPAVRRLLALAAGAAVAVAGAVILGEYELTGLTPIVAGVLFGVIVAEVMTVVGRRRDNLARGASAVLAAAGMVEGAWIASGDDWHYVAGVVWVGVALAAVAAVVWIKSPGRRGAGSPPAT